ncbi:hypothetical protein JKF63_05702 [Porcisia hertigi]|uniref:Uncharacterized protein n=1 Tax=Porcisia hertigi TaxID=2761500 RepID=A0A836HPM3_9TRYP|nr:hypothetical protein JKF63_05702 [Porcisia hertigi]
MAPQKRKSSRSAKRSRRRDATETPRSPLGTLDAAEGKGERRSYSASAEAESGFVRPIERIMGFFKRFKWQCITLLAVSLVLVAAGLAVLLSFDGYSAPRERHPCSCAVAASTSNRLAKAVLSRRAGVSGVHWKTEETGEELLAFMSKCTDGSVVTLSNPFDSVDELRVALLKPFKKNRSSCVVWIVTPEAIEGVANALKELMENNALSGRTVVPAHSRATLVLKSSKSREQLKSSLPHRVVHMLTEV